MYIQPPFSIPKGYSGNAFPEEPTVEASVKEEETAKEVIDEVTAPPEEAEEHAENEKEAVAASAAPSGASGIFSRFPFLSSLLPPPRRKKEKGGPLSEWVIIGIFLFLILEDNEQDLLPFLLLLLLWD